ncbi:MAG: hypothetical protein ACD_20C00173G0002 [uncultured bacterium]|nr:MAG: hypothetical protein ACD_20C00173G0002 [uncultured bacterium]
MLDSQINVKFQNFAIPQKQTKPETPKNSSVNPTENNSALTNYLSFQGNINKMNLGFKGNKTYNGYELALSNEEINQKLTNHSMVLDFSPIHEFKVLKEGDKKALGHLIKAAMAMDNVFYKQDDPKNLEMKAALEKAAKSGDKNAQQTLKIFNIFKGVEGDDRLSPEPVKLFKGLEKPEGKGFYPSDLKKEEFVSIIKRMLTEDKDKEVAKILSQRTIVVRDGDDLKGVDYTQEYQKEFSEAAKHLEEASKTVTHDGMKEYLQLQAEALRKEDAELDYKADSSWVKLQDSPLEFTISRESYDDKLTGAVLEDEELSQMLKERDIQANTKDSIGIRVGITDMETTKGIIDYKKHIKNLAKLMPYSDQYTQSVDSGEEIKQSIVDVKLLCLKGHYGAVRGGIVAAQNLPNDDKLAVQRGSGRRNVFHQQILNFENPLRRKLLETVINPSQWDLYDIKASNNHIVGHELTHSLGPGNEYKSALGNYGSIIEEAKADLGASTFTDYFLEKEKYTKTDKDKVLFNWVFDNLPISKPGLNDTYGIMRLMTLNYLRDQGAITMKQDGTNISVDTDKTQKASAQMLDDIVAIQLDKDPDKAKTYIEKWSKWDDTMETLSKTVKDIVKPKTYKFLNEKFAEKIASEV